MRNINLKITRKFSYMRMRYLSYTNVSHTESKVKQSTALNIYLLIELDLFLIEFI